MCKASCFVVLAALSAAPAFAQDARRQNPLDPAAKAPPAVYRSAFEGYRPFAEQELRDWRRSNDEVRAAAEKPARPPVEKPQGPAGTGAKHGGHK